MRFIESVSSCLQKSFKAKGRSSRSEFWWFALLYAVPLSLHVWALLEMKAFPTTLYMNSFVALLLLLPPMISVTVRRMHDCGLSSSYALMGFLCVLPSIGGLCALYLGKEGLAVFAEVFARGNGVFYGPLVLGVLLVFWGRLLYVAAQRGTCGPNSYGPDPLAPDPLTPDPLAPDVTAALVAVASTPDVTAAAANTPDMASAQAAAAFKFEAAKSENPMIRIDGKKTAADIRAELRTDVEAAIAKGQRAPGLAVILVGQDPASEVYVRNKERACAEAGIVSFPYHLPADTAQADLLALIDQLNQRDAVDGILLQLPLPDGLDAQACLLAIDPEKDVDGFHPVNVGRLSLGLPGFVSCTPAGVMELLRRYNLSPSGKKAVVVGRSNIVGKPLAMLLAQSGPFANATVTICHSRTQNLAEECASADFLFLALGRPGFVTGDMVREGAVVIDVGINRTPEGLCGDADFASVSRKASAITPVPGGVGPMTIAMLLKNTLQSWRTRMG